MKRLVWQKNKNSGKGCRRLNLQPFYQTNYICFLRHFLSVYILLEYAVFFISSIAEVFTDKNVSNGFLNRFAKNFTTIPVRKAEIIVPSLVPIIFISKNISDNIIDRTTHIISKAIFILPKFLLIVPAIALTKASPEFIITSAITDKEIPNPRIIIPIKTNARRTG